MGNRLKVLYAEDDEIVAEITELALEDAGGFEVIHCANGAIALEKFSEVAPDVVILDVMMPKLSGPEAMKQIRQLPGGERVPIIFMTAKIQDHERKMYRDYGVQMIIRKPFDPITLPATIKGVVGSCENRIEDPENQRVSSLA